LTKPSSAQFETVVSVNPHAARLSRLSRTITLLAVMLPLAGFITAMIMLWGVGFDWVTLIVFAVMYLATGFGVTIGFHRLFTHRAFETNRFVKGMLAIFGSMAVEGPVLQWVAAHRRHHQHSDEAEDPHSPHFHGGGVLGTLRGLWHAHTGWMFHPYAPGLSRYVGDLRKDPLVRRISALFPLWVLLSLVLPTVLGGLLTLSWMGALLGFLWGGLARIFLVHHITWSINSVCHVWGSQPFGDKDESRNNAIFGVLAMGEGWHNNHHAFPTSARHGLRWWELDTSYWLIRAMEFVGLAWNVKVPRRDAVLAKMERPAQRRHHPATSLRS
jgi:stearoyl-CoA desaturase (delta-9 desaturase)